LSVCAAPNDDQGPSKLRAAARRLTLTCHPETPSPAVRRVTVLVARAGGALTASYVIKGDLSRLRMPPPRAPRIAERLWQHTCCEIFIALAGAPAYHEFNFSPSGEWTAYAFERYRESRLLADELLDPAITVRRADDELTLIAVIRLGRLSSRHVTAKLSIALSAVLEDDAGALSYWALRHPPGRPDFHHPDAFALKFNEVRD